MRKREIVAELLNHMMIAARLGMLLWICWSERGPGR